MGVEVCSTQPLRVHDPLFGVGCHTAAVWLCRCAVGVWDLVGGGVALCAGEASHDDEMVNNVCHTRPSQLVQGLWKHA